MLNRNTLGAETACCGCRDDAGRRVAQQVGDLQHGTDEHELERFGRATCQGDREALILGIRLRCPEAHTGARPWGAAIIANEPSGELLRARSWATQASRQMICCESRLGCDAFYRHVPVGLCPLSFLSSYGVESVEIRTVSGVC